MISRICSLLKIKQPELNRGYLEASGTTVPTDGTDGYQTGCIFKHTDGSAEASVYVNEGSVTNCAFVPLLTTSNELQDLPDFGTMTYGSGKILVADGDSYEEVPVSGDATLAANGALTVTLGTSVTPGTVTASKAVVVDASKNIATFGTIGAATITAANDDLVDGVVDALVLGHSSSDNNATAADGVGISMKLENATGTSTYEEWASIDAVSTTITNGTEDGDVVVKTMLAGTVTEATRIDASDQSFTVGRNATDANGLNQLRIFPLTASKGSLLLTAVANTGDTPVIITNAAHGQQTTVTIPDSGLATSYVVQSTAAMTVAEANVLSSVTPGTAAASKALVLNASAGITTGLARLQVSSAPAAYTTPALGVGVYGTPVVDASLLDNIAFTSNMSIAVDKTGADTSCMSAFIGVSNTAATTNTKLQGLLASCSAGYNCYDAYAVQGHTTIGAGGVSTQNANAHLTGVSGKAVLTGAVGQGWVTGVLAIVEGAGAVTGLCHVIAAQVEATCTANVVDAILYLGADAVAVNAIELAGVANMTNFLKVNTTAGCVIANALVPAAAPAADTVGADACLRVLINATPYYIPLYDTLHA